MADKADILKALAHPLRLSFLEWMREPESHFTSRTHPFEMGVCAKQFEEKCGLSQSTVSAHLAMLEKAGLLTTNRVGQWAFYNRNQPVIDTFLSELRSTL